MDTKLKGDIAELAVATELLKRDFRVLKPIGDRLPYDLAVDIGNKFIRIQVKSAWFDKKRDYYVVETRRTKSNRRKILRTRYNEGDFDFAILYVEDHNVFYIMPFSVWESYKGAITLVEGDKRQREPKAAKYRNRWDLLSIKTE